MPPSSETPSLFDDGLSPTRATAPLAVRMRPRTLDELVGQRHLLTPGSPLRRLVEPGVAQLASGPVSVILWGPPGTGKTTLATMVSEATGRRFRELSAVTAGVKDVRAVIDEARSELAMHDRGTVLFVDEVHRFSKTQQDALLPAVENGWVTLIAATTENPSFSVVSPLLSRSLLLTLEPLTDDDVREVVRRALVDPRGLAGTLAIDQDAEDHLVRVAGGDARRALTALEAAAGAVLDAGGDTLDLTTVETAVQKPAVRYDRDGDQHYDVISAFIKSVRGSDVDSSLHYLARMLEAGEDPRFVARRLMILASEDVGMADPTALLVAVAAAQTVQLIGMPEARLTLAQATVHLALAPKSNSAYVAINEATADVRRGLVGQVPTYLRDGHYAGAQRLGHAQGYRYPHDFPGGLVEQDYAPEVVRGRRYYRPTRHGAEARWAEQYQRLQVALGRESPPVEAVDAVPPADAEDPALAPREVREG